MSFSSNIIKIKAFFNFYDHRGQLGQLYLFNYISIIFHCSSVHLQVDNRRLKEKVKFKISLLSFRATFETILKMSFYSL